MRRVYTKKTIHVSILLHRIPFLHMWRYIEVSILKKKIKNHNSYVFYFFSWERTYTLRRGRTHITVVFNQ